MKRIITSVIVLLVLVCSISNLFAVSEAALLFLLISPHARAAGMGEAFVAISDDVSAIYWNPAGLAFQKDKQFTTMYAKWLPQFNLSDLYYLFGAYRQSIEGLGTVGVNITYLNLGEQNYRDEANIDLGTFNSNEWAISLGYATLLSENLGVGLNFRFIRSNLAQVEVGNQKGVGVANAFAVDLGVLKKKFLIDKLSLGINVSNLGPKITYINASQADPIPTNFRAGFAYQLLDQEYNKVVLALDVNKLLVNRSSDGADAVAEALISAWGNNDYIFNLGGEYWYADIIALRAGYNHDEAGKVKFLSFGAGLRYANYQFDFAYVAAPEGHPLSDTMRFSLMIGQ